MTAILPKGVEALSIPTRPSWEDSFDATKYYLAEGIIPPAKAHELLESLPSETLRELISKIAGTDASFLATFTKQVRLVDAVLNQLVHPDGRLKESGADAGINLKDALTLSARISQMLLKDLPKLYKIDRIQRMEQAFGDVIEEYFTEEMRNKVLDRLTELSEDK